MNRILVTLCGRAGSKGFKNKNLKVFCGRPLVYYSLSAIQLFLQKRGDVQADVVLNTDSPELRELVLAKYGFVHPIERPGELAGDKVAKLAVFRHSLAVMEAETGRPYDVHMDFDITSPLRTLADVEGVLNTYLARDDLDVVMSAAKSRRSPFMNMGKREGNYVRQVIQTDITARQGAPVCYDINASLYAFRPAFLQGNTTGRVWDGRCEVYEMEDTGVLDIDSEEDFHLMEAVAGYLFETRPAFAEIRDNIGE